MADTKFSPREMLRSLDSSSRTQAEVKEFSAKTRTQLQDRATICDQLASLVNDDAVCNAVQREFLRQVVLEMAERNAKREIPELERLLMLAQIAAFANSCR